MQWFSASSIGAQKPDPCTSAAMALREHLQELSNLDNIN